MSQTAILGSLFAASIGTSILSTNQTSNSQATAMRLQGQFQQQQQNTNARIADLQASDAISRGDKAAADQQKKVKALIGTQRAALAAQGIEVNSDTALDIQADTAGLGALDVLTIKNNAAREAWGYKVQAADSRSQAAYSGISSNFNASQTLATGGLKIANDVTSGLYTYSAARNLKVK